MLPFTIVSDVQDAPADLRHPLQDCCVAPWWFRRHPPIPDVFATGPTVDGARGVFHSLCISSTCAPNRALSPERTVRTKDNWLFLLVPVCCLGQSRRTSAAHRCSWCNGKSVTVGPNQFSGHRTSFLTVGLRRTELCVDSCLTLQRSNNVLRQVSLMRCAISPFVSSKSSLSGFKSMVPALTGASSPARRRLAPNGLHEVPKVSRPPVLAPLSRGRALLHSTPPRRRHQLKT